MKNKELVGHNLMKLKNFIYWFELQDFNYEY